MSVDKRLVLVLVVLVIVAAGVYAFRALTAPKPQFLQFPDGPKPTGLPTQISPHGGATAPAQVPATGLQMPPGKGGRR